MERGELRDQEKKRQRWREKRDRQRQGDKGRQKKRDRNGECAQANMDVTVHAVTHNSCKWEPPECPSVGNKTWSTHTLEYHSAMRRSEGLTLTTTWMDFEHMMLSERSQTQEATNRVIPFTGNSQNRQILRDRK